MIDLVRSNNILSKTEYLGFSDAINKRESFFQNGISKWYFKMVFQNGISNWIESIYDKYNENVQ